MGFYWMLPSYFYIFCVKKYISKLVRWRNKWYTAVHLCAWDVQIIVYEHFRISVLSFYILFKGLSESHSKTMRKLPTMAGQLGVGERFTWSGTHVCRMARGKCRRFTEMRDDETTSKRPAQKLHEVRSGVACACESHDGDPASMNASRTGRVLSGQAFWSVMNYRLLIVFVLRPWSYVQISCNQFNKYLNLKKKKKRIRKWMSLCHWCTGL